MRKRTLTFVVILLVLSNMLTFQVTRNLERWRAYSAPPVAALPEPGAEEEKRDELAAFYEVLDILSERYIEEVTKEELIEAAIKGMVDSLNDPQTSFLDDLHWQRLMEQTQGSFTGIGIEIQAIDGYVTVIAPIKGTPAERAGLLPEDRIIEVDGRDIRGVTGTEAAELIRGPEGSTVTLKVLRGDEELTFSIVREKVRTSSVRSYFLDDTVGYIEITNFDDNTGYDFRVALLELENRGLSGLILDLRGNPGGLLSEAVKVAQELVPAGPITHVVDRDGNIQETYYSYGKAKPYPIVVLVNGSSASAAEIVAGALQDTKAGILLGTRTYGKATVQHLERLSGSAGLRYTVAKYLTPGGRDIHGVGLEPDIVLELTAEYTYLHPLTADMKRGDESNNVRFLQYTLALLGYPVEVSGVFDGDTEQAVRSFQRSAGLPVTGVVDRETRGRLKEEGEKALDLQDNQKQKALEIIKEMISKRS